MIITIDTNKASREDILEMASYLVTLANSDSIRITETTDNVIRVDF